MLQQSVDTSAFTGGGHVRHAGVADTANQNKKTKNKTTGQEDEEIKTITHETTARSAAAVTHISTASVCLPELKISYLFLLQTTSVHSKHISCRAALSSPYFHSSGGADPRRLCRIWFPCAHNSPTDRSTTSPQPERLL